MELPLLQRAQEGDVAFRLTDTGGYADMREASYCGSGTQVTERRVPSPGEQYRFHFDMTKCIGCKCCVVACNEQNGNSADILWRRVGEIEGGTYPNTFRHYLSMGCNHCLEPTCLSGCPVDAYSKDDVTGIVRHSADACIGCQYCTWNCSYGVPQFNPERGIVGKCDMCYGRLQLGQEPACASACPESAIEIEIVNVLEWRKQYRTSANSPGMPSADDSLSTTRITLPAKLPTNTQKVDVGLLRPQHAHWSLILMTVLTQLSVGAFTSIWILHTLGAQLHRSATLVGLGVAALALAVSTLHLGRPIHAIRAVKMWRRSWLSREVLLFSLFAPSSAAYSLAMWLGLPHSTAYGAVTVLLGLCGVSASARLYLVPGRPAWNSPLTIAEFWCTTALLGSYGANVLSHGAPQAHYAVFYAALATALVVAGKLLRVATSHVNELYGAWRLQIGVFPRWLAVRSLLLISVVVLFPYANHSWSRIVLVFLALGGELVGRYLFFVTVVPTNMAADYLAQEAR